VLEIGKFWHAEECGFLVIQVTNVKVLVELLTFILAKLFTFIDFYVFLGVLAFG